MTNQPAGRVRSTYPCAKCGTTNPDYLAFETGWPNRIRYWCLHHIPLRARIKVWWQERRRDR